MPLKSAPAPKAIGIPSAINGSFSGEGARTVSCYHGATSAMMGYCGFTLAPCSAENRGV